MPGIALYWWNMQVKLNKQDGVQRAHAAMATTVKGGRITKNDDSVTFVSENLIATIACLPRGKNEIQVIVIAAGQDGNSTRSVMEQLRDGMRRGGPFE